jgi:myo-inositol-1(or 4)-monophosphatase
MAESFVEVAIGAAKDAGALLRERLGRPRDVQFKGTVDLVTDADRASEALIAGRIREAFPGHRILGEEGARGARAESDGDRPAPFGWLIDPLDGTTNYAHGFPHFAVSIGLERDGTVLVGVIYDPMRDELFVAERGRGAVCNGVPLRVSETDELIQAVVTTGFSYDLALRAVQAATWRAFLTRARAIRQTGSAALNLAYIAAGRLDAFWERPLSPWDMGAGALLVEEAGGRVSDFGDGSFDPYGTEIVATNGRLHGTTLGVIAEHIAPPPDATPGE